MQALKFWSNIPWTFTSYQEWEMSGKDREKQGKLGRTALLSIVPHMF